MTVDEKAAFIAAAIGKTFPCYGQGSYTRPGTESPISRALADKPLQFASGVNVEHIVKFVLMAEKRL